MGQHIKNQHNTNQNTMAQIKTLHDKAKDKEMIEQMTLQGSWHGLGSHCHRKKT